MLQNSQEIERKFLISLEILPISLSDYPNLQLIQGYLAVSEDGSEVRIRNRDGQYTLTGKSGGDLSRMEVEIDISREQYDELWPLTEGSRIEKRRYEIPLGENVVELDVFSGHHTGLVIAEVEFRTESESKLFVAPEWFGEEKTSDKRYKNKNLAFGGLPKADS